MNGAPQIRLTIDSAEGQLQVSGPLSLLRAYLRAFRHNDDADRAADEADDAQDLLVAVDALAAIAADQPTNGYLVAGDGLAATALAQIRRRRADRAAS
jgi:hypothetical protein